MVPRALRLGLAFVVWVVSLTSPLKLRGDGGQYGGFRKFGSLVRGWPHNKGLTILESIFGPLIFGNFRIRGGRVDVTDPA